MAGIATAALAIVALGVLVAPDLPRLSAPHALNVQQPTSADLSSSRIAELPISLMRNRSVPDTAARATRFAFFTADVLGSIPALRRNAGEIDALIPDWLEIGRDGTLKPETRRSPEVLAFLQSEAPQIDIYPRLTSNALGLTETALVLTAPHTRARLVAQVAQYLERHNCRGVAVDLLEDVPRTSRRALAAFVAELGARLREGGRKTISVIPPSVAEDRLDEIVQASDLVLLAVHDQAIDRPGSGPVAAQGWFETKVARFAARVGARKLVVAIGSFGYDWDLRGGRRELSVQAAWELLDRAGTSLRFDARTLNPAFSYVSAEGARHEVWFLDGVTAYNQVRAALALEPAGIAIWQLGLEDPGVWASAGRNRLPDARALEALRTPAAGYDGYSRVRGVVLSAVPGSAGSRTFSLHRGSELIVDQRLVKAPRHATVTTWSAVDPKAVVLTFDDGPDPVFTPKILDILAAKSVRATFYVTGKAAVRSPGLLRRIYDEGHEIGHHSFSHENLLRSSSHRLQLELNSVQRILEAEVGIHSILFRPPYAYATFRYLDDGPHVAETASSLGYLIANLEVDGFDWFSPTEAIVRGVTGQVAEGVGQVVLLHDAGGNRQPTVEALPRLIDELRAKGYRFVTTYELLGRPRDEFMPPHDPRNLATRAESGLRLATFDFVRWIGGALPAIAIVATAFGIIRLALVIVGACVQRRRRVPATGRPWLPERIGVLVPAYNEAKVICKTVRTLLASTVRDRLDIIVIDDGSSDGTAALVRQEFADSERVKVLSKDNAGKAAALNHGLAHAEAEVLVSIDADTVVLPDAIEALVARFEDPSVGAVAGKIVVGNPVNLLTRFQSLEYITSQNLDRRAFELCNAVSVVPGALGAWRRQAVIEAGGYSQDTLAEDADLTFALERRGWKVVAEPAAKALTEAPERLRGFLKQRFRWMFGTLQAAVKHRAALLGPPSGVSLVTIPNVFLFQFAFTLLAPVMDALLIWTLVTEAFHLDTLVKLSIYWALFQALDAAAAMTGIRLDGDPSGWRLLPLIVLQRFSYRQLLYVVAVRALLAAIKGRLVGWGKLIRTGSVAMPLQPGQRGGAV